MMSADHAEPVSVVRARWFVRIAARRQPSIQLFHVPHAGAGGAAANMWRRALTDRADLWTVRLPGREMRMQEQPYRDIHVLTTEVSEIIRRNISGPYILYGHSLGALLAFELAYALSKAPPAALMVSGRVAPHLTPPSTLRSDLSDHTLIERLRVLGGTPHELLESREVMELSLATLRADLALAESYQFVERPALQVPIFAFAGHADSAVPLAGLQAWSVHTAEQFSALVFSGGHFFQLEDPRFVSEVSALLDQLA